MVESQPPARALRHLIRYYYQVRDRLTQGISLTPVPARSPQILEFMFGTPYEVFAIERGVTELARPIALVGAQTYRRVELTLKGRVDAFTMAFAPGGVEALFGLPAVELTDAHFDGEEVLGNGLSELHERLAELDSFAARVRIADDYLCRRLPAHLNAGGVIRGARTILSSQGQIRVSHLANCAGLGLRQFERRFRQEVGMPPKLYSKIVRFEAALQLKLANARCKWTDIAHDLGYHDQMHMVHDFKCLAAASPTGIWDQLDMFVKPEVESSLPGGGRVPSSA